MKIAPPLITPEEAVKEGLERARGGNSGGIGMSWDKRLNVLLIGGGMISQEVVIPTLLQERRGA